MPDETELTKLANQVLYVLSAQQEFFTTRDPKKLERSKALETKLRTKCQSIVDGTYHRAPKQLEMFGEEPGKEDKGDAKVSIPQWYE